MNKMAPIRIICDTSDEKFCKEFGNGLPEKGYSLLFSEYDGSQAIFTLSSPNKNEPQIEKDLYFKLNGKNYQINLVFGNKRKK